MPPHYLLKDKNNSTSAWGSKVCHFENEKYIYECFLMFSAKISGEAVSWVPFFWPTSTGICQSKPVFTYSIETNNSLLYKNVHRNIIPLSNAY